MSAFIAPSAPSMPNPHGHSRRRPKLSLQISSNQRFTNLRCPPSALNSSLPPTAPLSPTARNTLHNTHLRDPEPSPSSSSSSSSSDNDDDECDAFSGIGSLPSLKSKRRQRLFTRRQKAAQLSSQHHPTTLSASFLPRPQPSIRGVSPSQRRVRFDPVPEVFLCPEEEEYEEENADGRTEMEKFMELERLKKLVCKEGEEAGRGNLWVRRLVEMELGEMEE